MLTVYLVLLVALPSNLALSALGAYGRPQFLWGIVLFLWWGFTRVQSPSVDLDPVRQPVRVALAVFFVIVLIGFAVALLRGQPADQVSPAISSVLRLLSWSGVVLVAIDGIRSMNELLAMVQRIVITCSSLAALGIAQFLTGQSFLEPFDALPGFSESAGGVDTRGMFLRSSATATHPLEYGTALSIAVPLALAVAMLRVSHRQESQRLRWWLFLGLLAAASFLAVSRSTLIGFVVAIVLMIPALPKRFRVVVVAGGVLLGGAVMVATPGLYGTIVGMFAGVGADTSTLSRQVGLEMAPVFLSASPLIGVGAGTLLPRYLIFDNQWLGILIETGLLGTLAFAALLLAAIWSGASAGRGGALEDTRLIGRALAVSVATAALLLAFFDGFSFPIATGLLFVAIGLCGATRSIASADAQQFPTSAQPRRRWDRWPRSGLVGSEDAPQSASGAVR
ncbi:O-antigen ligase family protein [Microbacterium sp. nov. GSS16]|uniref:O-antigen ligase family protein n=1 Tax=Microbacterium sp. nov. GSS16 TaxID=3019890 RepID=UPI0023059B3F|nr:O-antigen ligase family protein [Microbacterium sp. nov. GSS16]WCD92911.1 O-antigen ligase family protein [Microbacterium sp. nov. GSS16]